MIVYLWPPPHVSSDVVETDANSLVYGVVKQSPEILRIDENAGSTFELPQQGDGEHLRLLVSASCTANAAGTMGLR